MYWCRSTYSCVFFFFKKVLASTAWRSSLRRMHRQLFKTFLRFAHTHSCMHRSTAIPSIHGSNKALFSAVALALTRFQLPLMCRSISASRCCAAIQTKKPSTHPRPLESRLCSWLLPLTLPSRMLSTPRDVIQGKRDPLNCFGAEASLSCSSHNFMPHVSL